MALFCNRKWLSILLFVFSVVIVNISHATIQTTDYNKPKGGTSSRVVNSFIIVDVQNCFITGNLSLSKSPARQNAVEVVPIINHLLQTVQFDLIIFTHDWHPSNHISFFDNLENRRQYLKGDKNQTLHPLDTVIYTGPKFEMEQVLWPAHCIQETDDAALHKDLIVNSSKNNVIHIRKGLDPDIDSYSAFWDNNKHKKTELDGVLKQWNVTHVYVAGLATDFCVAATASDAIELNYTTYLIEDACRGVANETIKNKTEEMRQRGISIIHSTEVKTLVNIASYNQISFLFIIFLLFSAIIFK